MPAPSLFISLKMFYCSVPVCPLSSGRLFTGGCREMLILFSMGISPVSAVKFQGFTCPLAQRFGHLPATLRGAGWDFPSSPQESGAQTARKEGVPQFLRLPPNPPGRSQRLPRPGVLLAPAPSNLIPCCLRGRKSRCCCWQPAENC